MLKYEVLKEKLEEMLNDFKSVKLEVPMTKEQFSQRIGYDIGQHWDDTKCWGANEYNTQDFQFIINTIEKNGSQTQMQITLEVNNDLITHLTDVDEY